MNQRVAWLGFLLGLQLLLAVAMWLSGLSGKAPANQRLLQFSGAQVTQLSIDDGTQAVELLKGSNGWELPALDNAPADGERIAALLAQLEALEVSWPISTSAASQQRFAVAADTFQRKVQLRDSTDVLATLYVGTSPGFRQAHVRVADADAVYATSLNTFDLPTQTDAWRQPAAPAAELPAAAVPTEAPLASGAAEGGSADTQATSDSPEADAP